MSSRVYKTRRHESDPHDMEGGPRKWRWHEPTGYIFWEAWARVGLLGLTREEYRLLCGLVAACEWGNRCRLTQTQLGRSVGLAGSHTSRAMRGLVAARLAHCERQRPGQAYTVTLSPYLCWKGRPWHLARARQDFQARWQLQHGHKAASQPRREDEASPGVGAFAPGEDPSFPYHPLEVLSSA